jgi:hypothetical protein
MIRSSCFPRSFLVAVVIGVLLLIAFLHTASPAPAAALRPLRCDAPPQREVTGRPAVLAPCAPANPKTCDGVCATMLAYIRAERAKSSWRGYYADIAAEIRKRGIGAGTFVEIGTAFGGLPLYLLAAFPELRIIAVDPFLGAYDGGDAMSSMYVELKALHGEDTSALYARALAFEAGELYGCRYSLRRAFSDAAAREFPLHSIDAVFIDGDHTRAGVETDIRAWSPVVAWGRPLLFNDCNFMWPGVEDAVACLAARTDQQVRFIGEKHWGNVMLYNVPGVV